MMDGDRQELGVVSFGDGTICDDYIKSTEESGDVIHGRKRNGLW